MLLFFVVCAAAFAYTLCFPHLLSLSMFDSAISPAALLSAALFVRFALLLAAGILFGRLVRSRIAVRQTFVSVLCGAFGLAALLPPALFFLRYAVSLPGTNALARIPLSFLDVLAALAGFLLFAAYAARRRTS